MDIAFPMSRLNQISLFLCVISASLSLMIQEWIGLAPISLYITLLWAVCVIILSTWLSCYMLQLTFKAHMPIDIEFLNKWFYSICQHRLNYLSVIDHNKSTNSAVIENQVEPSGKKQVPHNDVHITKKEILHKKESEYFIDFPPKTKALIDDTCQEIIKTYVKTWYKDISDDPLFLIETEVLLKKLLMRLFMQLEQINKMELAKKFADILLLHLKEYRRALRRVEKGASPTIEDAYKYHHPGSRSTSALEHLLHRLVVVLAQEFLQWELISSLPCKMLLSILSKRLLMLMETISNPNWIFIKLLALLQCTPGKNTVQESKNGQTNGVVSTALSDGITSATAPVIPRSLSPSTIQQHTSTISEDKTQTMVTSKLPSLCLENTVVEHRGLWGHGGISEVDLEIDEDRISPVYEEPTDFATTIARLRNVLQQKSTATTPLHHEEKSYVVYEGCQFTNLSIPWTEFHTAADGSQQLLYCIQFDDVEQHGEDLFETTTATVRRQYIDFVQLHNALEEIPSIAGIMSGLVLPEGGRLEMEAYLRTLSTRLSNECPPQLRHFLRPNSGGNKKADAVAPRFDRLLAKTVSGVFNTLKTVVPGFEMDQEEEIPPMPTLMPLADIPWRFIEDSTTRSLSTELQRLLSEKTDYCPVDTAYEAVDTTELNGESDLSSYWWEMVDTSYDEELDELDSSLPLTCAMIDIICELLAGISSNNTLQQEAVVRWTKLLFGNITEPIIQKIVLWLFDNTSNIPVTSARLCEISGESTELKKQQILQILEAKIPYDIKLIFGKNDVKKMLQYLLDSCEVKKINLDLNIRILDVLASQLLISCTLNRKDLSP